jgi:hypothetical protein
MLWVMSFPLLGSVLVAMSAGLFEGERSLRFQGVGNQTSQEPDLGTDRIWGWGTACARRSGCSQQPGQRLVHWNPVN